MFLATRVLVTGSVERIDGVAAALRGADTEVMTVTDLGRLGDEVAALPPGSIDCYIQLPVTLRPSGETTVSRVRDFLDKGLVTRFRLAETVLPGLSDEGRVVLVGGHTPGEGGALDDQAARLALLHVLAHAIRADKAPAKVRVRVVPHEQDPAEIARLVLTWQPAASRPSDLRAALREENISYQDWRTEVMGLVSIEF
jgi:hypothetical protein